MTLKAESKTCIVCGASFDFMVEKILRCPQCGLFHSTHKAGFGNPIKGMTAIAHRNYATVATALQKVMHLQGAKILDVGCAEGGFTELMLLNGADCLGVEPDREAAKDALKKKLPVKLVSFEEFAVGEKKYDAIVFNDVFEHIQDPIQALEKSCRLLKSRGFVLINAPVSSGLIFRIVAIAARLGIKSPFRRIWADGLCSPHIYFYNANNLKALLANYHFELADSGQLVSLTSAGLYQRVRSTYRPLPALIITAVASLFVLISKNFPADVIYLLFKKK
jgi:SAM-dependent methyltransferase